MREISSQLFECLYDHGGGRNFSDIHFNKCSFESCGFSITHDPLRRSVARNVRFTNCSVGGSALDSGIFENVVVDGLKTRGLFQGWGLAFRRVVLKGRIGRVMFSPMVGITVRDDQARFVIQEAFDRANADFYRNVDWALDISGGEFDECEIRGVPARLMRRDSATQMVVKREKVLQGAWRELNLSGTHWAKSLEFLLERDEEDIVLVAGKRNKNFHRLLEGLELLRNAGVAERQ